MYCLDKCEPGNTTDDHECLIDMESGTSNGCEDGLICEDTGVAFEGNVGGIDIQNINIGRCVEEGAAPQPESE